MLLLGMALLAQVANARVFATSAVELNFTYETNFISLLKTADLEKLSEAKVQKLVETQVADHAFHIFGLFQSPELAKSLGIKHEYVGGTGALRLPLKYSGIRTKPSALRPEFLEIKYSARGRMLVHRKAAASWLDGAGVKGTVRANGETADVVLPMLADLPAVYETKGLEPGETPDFYTAKKWKKCTDKDLDSPLEFSYFYDPFLDNGICTALARPPLARDVHLQVSWAEKTPEPESLPARLDELRGDNQNGGLYTLYFLEGFDEAPKRGGKSYKRDDSYKIWAGINSDLVKKYGFNESCDKNEFENWLGGDRRHLNRQLPVCLNAGESKFQILKTYTREMRRPDGSVIKVIVRNLLIATDLDWDKPRPRRTFPKFWKEAWENGDFVEFGGHTGGDNLDPANLAKVFSRADVEDIDFDPRKRQFAFIDACSSYAYYLEPYSRSKAARYNTQLMSYGMPSYFYTALDVSRVLMEMLFAPEEEIAGADWQTVLGRMERGLAWGVFKDESNSTSPAEFNQWYGQARAQGDLPTYLLNIGMVH
jgi:hypothetical protein